MVEGVCYLMEVLMVLVGVAFLTLLERKVLGYIQVRKGPNKVGWAGVLQPMADAVKLFTKEQSIPLACNFNVYYISPVLSLGVSLICWCVLPFSEGLMNLEFSVLFVFCVLSVGVYPLLSAGWSSNSKYPLLGCLRGIAQTISYEVSLAFILICGLILAGGAKLALFEECQRYMWLMVGMFPLSVMWFTSALAETNRTPFDFSEGESELVSGFNTEYSGGGFALIFMAEYSSILFMSGLISMVFLGSGVSGAWFYFKLVFVSFCFVWVRGSLPRFRYDKLMNLSWKSFLPVSLNYFLLFSGVSVIIICLYL